MRIVRLLPTIALADQRGGEFCARPLFKTPVLSATIASLQPQLAGAFSQSRNVSVIRSIYIVPISFPFPYQSSNWKTRASLDWYP
jgi:hypothetical protein